MIKNIVISAFYKFFDFNNYQNEKKNLLDFCNQNNLKGTILLAKEGINSTISGTKEGINSLYEYLKNVIGINDLIYKESFSLNQPFCKMKVRLKKEIVTLGVGDLDIEKNVGEYLESEEWDKLISQKDVLVIDTRNSYEINLGTFSNSIDPKTRSFREFPTWVKNNLMDKKDEKIAMFCTGGIRCEKSTTYLKELGFKNVYHLKGGILKYLEDTKNKNNKWLGSCFVFDERIAVNQQLNPSYHNLCMFCKGELENEITGCMECI